MVFPWQERTWQRLVGAMDRLPHALLLAGPAGTGKRNFAQTLAQRVLCENPSGGAYGCGKCSSCQWLASGNHPDFRLVVPSSESPEDGGEGQEQAETTASGKTRKASNQIVIDQIRALNGFVSVGTHRQGLRVILLHPAEAMNVYTANALLKLLEEPTPSTLFILVSNAHRQLLPTIRSRCQSVVFERPDPVLARNWLAQQGAFHDPEALLAFAGGMPLLACELGHSGGAGYRQQFLASVAAIDKRDPLHIAASWDGWLKQKNEGGFVPKLSTLAAWLQKWVFDLALWKLAGRGAFHPQARDELGRLAARSSIPELFGCYNELSQIRRVADHPVNSRLFLEDMLLRYARTVAATRSHEGIANE